MSVELNAEQLKFLLSTAKKYDALLDVVNKMQEILGKKSISKLIGKKDTNELFKLYEAYLTIE